VFLPILLSSIDRSTLFMSRSHMNSSSTSKFHRHRLPSANLHPPASNKRNKTAVRRFVIGKRYGWQMAKIPDPLGAKDEATEYQLRGRLKANKSRAKSIAGVIVTVILVVAALTVLLRSNPQSDPAPNGSPGTGINRMPGPASDGS